MLLCLSGGMCTRACATAVENTPVNEDGDGFHEVHVNTMEGFWSLLRSWLRPHRGLSQEKLPIYLGFFEFVHNVRRRGQALLGSLFGFPHFPTSDLARATLGSSDSARQRGVLQR